jgi:hypothetical protein
LIAELLEKDGLPRIAPLFGMRYWPAIKKWLDDYNDVVWLPRPGELKANELPWGARSKRLPKEKPCTPGRKRQIDGQRKIEVPPVVPPTWGGELPNVRERRSDLVPKGSEVKDAAPPPDIEVAKTQSPR